MPGHPKLEEYLDACIGTAGLADDRKGQLFRSALGKTGQLSARSKLRGDGAWCVAVLLTPGLKTRFGCHTFRATGITDYLTNGGLIEVAQRRAGYSNAKTTGLYDRRNDDIGVGEVERIGI
jgi:integrase/recombinase XerD